MLCRAPSMALPILRLKYRVYMSIKGRNARIMQVVCQCTDMSIAAAPTSFTEFISRSSGTWWKNSARDRVSLVIRDIRSPTVWLS